MHDKDFEDVLNVPFLEGLKSQIGVIGACVQGFSAISNHSWYRQVLCVETITCKIQRNFMADWVNKISGGTNFSISGWFGYDLWHSQVVI